MVVIERGKLDKVQFKLVDSWAPSLKRLFLRNENPCSVAFGFGGGGLFPPLPTTTLFGVPTTLPTQPSTNIPAETVVGTYECGNCVPLTLH